MTVSIDVLVSFTVTGWSDREELREQADLMTEALLALEPTCDISDSTVSLDLGQSLMTVELSAAGETFEAAEETARSCVRTAIHSAGGKTRDWDFSPKEQHAELVSTRAEA